ncbi:GspH/FimT family pseudopilin [Luteimonas gilva]|nr:GspH/FimT family pseudopilin [Luteimonas gilva]
MIVVVIVAVLTAIAFPSFQGSMRSNRVATTSNELMASFALARTEAIRSKVGSGVCTSANGTGCGGTWNDGWIVWTDGAGGKQGELDPGETVIRYVKPNQRMTMSGSAVILGFDPRGRSMAGSQTIGVKPKDYDKPARCVVLTATGQMRIQDTCS